MAPRSFQSFTGIGVEKLIELPTQSKRKLSKDWIVMAANNRLISENEQGIETMVASFVSSQRLIRDALMRLVRKGVFETELEALAFEAQLVSWGQDDDPSQKSRDFSRLGIDVTDWVWNFIKSRAGRYGGKSNVTVEVRGRTGTGKSSLAVSIFMALGVPVSLMAAAVSYHPYEFIIKYRRAYDLKVRGELHPIALLLDEDDEGQIGEGAASHEKMLATYEGRMRQAGLSMIFCRANKDDEFTRDITFVTFANNITNCTVYAWVFVGEELLGVARIPWVAEEVFRAYDLRKQRGVELAMSGVNPDAPILNAIVYGIVTDGALMDDLDKVNFAQVAVKAELKDTQAGTLPAGMLNDVVERVRLIGAEYGNRKNSPRYEDMLQTMRDKGLAWE